MTAFFKDPPIESTPLRRAAEGKECTMNVAGVCNYDPSTTIPAHINFEGGCMGGKTDDISLADCCFDCHQWYDNEDGTEEERHFYGARAVLRTLKRRVNEGLITIKGWSK